MRDTDAMSKIIPKHEITLRDIIEVTKKEVKRYA